ncbi:MAG: hypothetical protein ACO1QR_03100, partial [Chthoniobacteraceae bacterium]
QEAVGAETPFPQGTGIASLVITNQGAVRITGTLADGTAFSQGGQLSSDGELLVYIPMYGERGLLAGSVIFPTTDGEVAAGGTAEWIKPPTAGRKKLYPAGFHLKLEVVGEAVGSAPAASVAAVARAAAPTANRELTLFAGNLAEPVVRTFLPTQSPAPQALAGQGRLKISLKRDGRFSGSFDDTDRSTRRRFMGAYLPTHDVGAGFFLGSNEAGGVILEPVQ